MSLDSRFWNLWWTTISSSQISYTRNMFIEVGECLVVMLFCVVLWQFENNTWRVVQKDFCCFDSRAGHILNRFSVLFNVPSNTTILSPDYRGVLYKFNRTTCFGQLPTIIRSNKSSYNRDLILLCLTVH
jgi:hypothetical protein